MTASSLVAARARGNEVVRFLHDTSTQDLLGLEPGKGARTAFLDDKGRVQAEARALLIEDGSVLLVAEQAARVYLTGGLARIAPLSGCSITEEGVVVTAVRGKDAAEAFADVPLPSAEHDHVVTDGMRVVRVEWGGPGFDVLAPNRVALDARAADPWELEVERIASGQTRFGVDVTTDVLVNETPLLAHAVAMDKGCYPGQESVARVHNLGSIRRRFVLVRLEGSPPVVPANVYVDEDDVGRMTSAADGAGIAVVRASLEPGQQVSAGGVRGVIERTL